MSSPYLPLPTPIAAVCDEIAENAGVRWNEPKLAVLFEDAPPDPVEQIDPFFESLGRWDREAGTITVYRNRCRKCAEQYLSSVFAVAQVVAIHHIAHAVTQLGEHLVNGNTYIDAGNPANTVRNERNHTSTWSPFYDDLIREEELFAQIFTYRYLLASHDPGEPQLRVFDLISAGKDDIFTLAPQSLVPQLARRDWKAEIDADPERAMRTAAVIFGHLTRAVPVDKSELLGTTPEPELD